MYYSIEEFIEKDIKEIEKIVGKITTGGIDAEDLSEEIRERVLKLKTNLLGEIYESLDDEVCEKPTKESKE